MKTVLFVILDQYADWEAAYLSALIMFFGQGDYNVKTVSATKDGVISIGGFTALPDYDLASAPTDFEALILVGGMSWRTETAKQVEPLVRRAVADGKVLGGICDATVFLGALGVLNKVHHTSNDLNALKQWAGDAYTGDALYLRQQAVRDNNIVTANGTASLEFAREVLLALDIAPENAIEAQYNFYKRGAYEAPLPGM